MPVPAVPVRPRRDGRPPARPVLAAAMAMSGYTNRSIAERVGCTSETVGRIVRGIVNPSQGLRERIADVLGVTNVDGLFALSASVQRLVDGALEAGIDPASDGSADRLVEVLMSASSGRRSGAA